MRQKECQPATTCHYVTVCRLTLPSVDDEKTDVIEMTFGFDMFIAISLLPVLFIIKVMQEYCKMLIRCLCFDCSKIGI